MVIITTMLTAAETFICAKCNKEILKGERYKNVYCSVRASKQGSYIKTKNEKQCLECSKKYKFKQVEVGNESI